MKAILVSGALAAFIAVPALAQTGTATPGSATSAASPAPAAAPSTSAVANPNRYDPANSHLRRDCFDANTQTFKATRECDALRMGGAVASGTTAPSVGTTSSQSSTTTTGTNILAPSPTLAGSPPPATAPKAPPTIGSK